MLSNVRIIIRLGLLVLILMTFIAGLSYLSVTGLGDMRAGIKTVYEDRTIPMGQLAEIQRDYFEIRFAVLGALNSNDVATVQARETDIAVLDKISTKPGMRTHRRF
ncbi:MAG: hypothetical protein EXR11_05295 [Rhodospirillaceae bacterium]|nr:hypothetical protein [Rhodospirillaceae bacterium]